jgi:hypothetical protein
MNDLVAGQIDLIVDQTSNSIGQVRAGPHFRDPPRPDAPRSASMTGNGHSGRYALRGLWLRLDPHALIPFA